jgi:polyisoprenoid-binding protein YceI
MGARSPLLFAGLVVLSLASPARAEKYTIDNIHSSLIFRIKHMDVGYIYGRFNTFSGGFAFDEKSPADNALSVEIQADSVDSANAARDKHLKGNDFFNVREFPKITFKSTKFKAVDAKTYEVAGDLTLHGVSKSVTARLERTGTAEDKKFKVIRTGFETTFTIKRSDFGMKFGIPFLGDEVRITFAAEGTRKP